MGEDFDRCDLCCAKLCGFSSPADLSSFSAPIASSSVTALLPCLHSFCQSCKAKCEQASLNHETLICQICRTECLRSHVLNPPNANDFIRRCESAACPDKSLATAQCTVCNEALCADCSLAHQRVTATSSHFLEALSPVIPECIRCRIHSNMRIVTLCQCGSYLCMTCIANRLHQGPSHVLTSLIQRPNAHIDENKLMSSTAREAAFVDCSLSTIIIRKNALRERIANLKKEVGNQVVHICQAVMRRGNDLLRALDAIQFYKGQEYDRLRNELFLQKRRFSRINSFASRIKDFEDLTTIAVMRQFLENCITVIKAKKVRNERSLIGLQRPTAVQFRPDTEHILAGISQWGRIFAEVDDVGTLKNVEVTPTPHSTNPIDVPLFDISTNRSGGSCPSTNINAQHSYSNGSGGPSTSDHISIRPSISQEHSRLLQQHFHVQELASRQMQNARKQGFPQSQFFYSLLTENSQRPGSIQLPGPRYSCPYSPVCPFNLPTAQILPHGSQRMFLPNSVPHQQPRAPNLVEARCNIHRISNVQLTNSQSGSNLSVAPFGPRVSTNSLIKRFEEAIAQTGRLGVCGRVPVPGSDSNSVLPFSPVTLSIASSSSVTIDTQPSNNSNNPVVCTSASDDRSGVCLNSQVSNFGVTLSVEQKCAPTDSGTSTSTCVSSPPPKDPEPAPLKITLSVEKNNDRVVKVNDKTQLDQNKLSGSEQIRAGVEQRADSDESRWDDYCYVCQQGCDAKTGSLGCCARCPRVFHNICHIPAIKKQMEKLPDEWACSLCTEAEPLHENTGTMGQRERLLCSKVLLSCYEKHLDVEPFCKPVPRSVVNYHVIIKQPMDFSTIARRLKGKSKDAFTNVTQFIQCMNLVFENCSTFNAPGDEVAKAGRSVYQIYSRAVKKYLPCMKSQVWLYVNIYSENRRAGLIQREQNTQASSSTSRVHETSAEPPTKKLKKEVKSEFNRTT